MRRLATKLGVAPMAAYRHVNGKDDLWALMIDRAWEFAFGLDCVLDGIGQRLGI
ncbi:hypothetical protein GCM10010228_46420 [Streptomyces massasporeus]|nr:hypothetical protein GCM10010228_46420 [Streptomyces massasporeus]